MKVVLVDNVVLPERGSFADLDVHPHLGLLALAAVAESAGHHIRIVDPKRGLKWGQLAYDSTFYGRVADEILAHAPDAVGLTTLGCSLIFAVGVAARLKNSRPDLPVLLGGPHATMLHREVLERFTQFDIVVRHEADETFPAVLDALDRRDFERIPGISWRTSDCHSRLAFTEGKPKVNDLDSLPIASYSHYPIEDLGLDLLRIEAGRGCPFACTFCSTAGFFQRSFRLKSAERLVNELDVLHARYGCTNFKLDHDLFTVNKRKVLEFCEAVRGRGYTWRASARVDCVDDALLTAMADAGCVHLYFGIETGSVRMQEISQKRLALGLVEPTLKQSARLGIATTASFITGYPEETAEDQDATFDLMGKCFRPGCLSQLHMLAPEPGTPIFDRLRSTLAYDGYAGPYNASLIDADDWRLVQHHPDLFSTYYYYPAVLPRSRYVFGVELAQILRRAGPVLVGYLLRTFDGKLSALAEALREYLKASATREDVTAATFEAFVRTTFGASHHMTSLFRYALSSTSRMDRDLPAASNHVRLDPCRTYTLSPFVELLPDLHDCRFVIDCLADLPDGSELLEERVTGDLGLGLLVFTRGGPTSYWADSATEPIIRLFEHPRSAEEVMSLLSTALSSDHFHARFLEEIANAGIIVPVAATAQVHARAVV